MPAWRGENRRGRARSYRRNPANESLLHPPRSIAAFPKVPGGVEVVVLDRVGPADSQRTRWCWHMCREKSPSE